MHSISLASVKNTSDCTEALVCEGALRGSRYSLRVDQPGEIAHCIDGGLKSRSVHYSGATCWSFPALDLSAFSVPHESLCDLTLLYLCICMCMLFPVLMLLMHNFTWKLHARGGDPMVSSTRRPHGLEEVLHACGHLEHWVSPYRRPRRWRLFMTCRCRSIC